MSRQGERPLLRCVPQAAPDWWHRCARCSRPVDVYRIVRVADVDRSGRTVPYRPWYDQRFCRLCSDELLAILRWWRTWPAPDDDAQPPR